MTRTIAPVDLTPLCTACVKPVDLRSPHVVLTIEVRTERLGERYPHATRVLGTWHKPCARSWPIPSRYAPHPETPDAPDA